MKREIAAGAILATFITFLNMGLLMMGVVYYKDLIGAYSVIFGVSGVVWMGAWIMSGSDL